MHNNQRNFPAKPMLPLPDRLSYYMQNAHMASLFDGLFPPGNKPRFPFGNVDIQPSNACPRNFIIFDQTNNTSQIMLHPEINSKMFYPAFGTEPTLFEENVGQKDANDEREVSSELKEDSGDIDALLSTEYEEDGQSDDEVSTARTNTIYRCNSPDSCSNYVSASKKSRSLFRNSSRSHGNVKKCQRVSKMMNALKEIVPGAKRMSSVAVLDEAVRYLKSLRMEVKKIGAGNLIE